MMSALATVVCIGICLWFDVGTNATSDIWLEWVGPDAATAVYIQESETNTRDYIIVWEVDMAPLSITQN